MADTIKTWRQRLAEVLEWNPVDIGLLLMALIIPVYSQSLLWLFYVLGRADRARLVNVPLTRHLVVAILVLLAVSCAVLLLGLWVRRRYPNSILFQYVAALWFGLSLVGINYVLGTLNFAGGVVTLGASVFGFIVARRQVVWVASIASMALMLALVLATDAGLLPYAPGVVPPTDASSRAFWLNSYFSFAVSFLVFLLVLADQALAWWRKREDKIRELSRTDMLTGIHNRRHIMELLEREVAHTVRHGPPFAVVILDLDHFKRINDTWGHPTGDRVLQEAARVLGNSVRQGDAVGRYGGEEFMILLPATSLDGATTLMERCRARLAEVRLTADNGQTFGISGSFGVACNEELGQFTGDMLIKAADAALYRAKESGRNRVESVLYSSTEVPRQRPQPARPFEFFSIAAWRHRLAGVQEWSAVDKALVILGLANIVYGQYLLWYLYAWHRPDHDRLINAAWMPRFVDTIVALQVASVCLFLAGLWVRRRHTGSILFQHLATQFFALSLVGICYFLGTLNFAGGVMLLGAPIFGFIVLERRVVWWATAVATLTVIALVAAADLELLPYAPLVLPAADHSGSVFWVDSHLGFGAPFLLVILLLTDQALAWWRKREDTIRDLSRTDVLTGIHNRRSIMELLDLEVGRTLRHGPPISLVILDLDHFKRVNDTWGHPTGDRVLQEAARILRSNIRQSDAIGRYGGEEFMILLPSTPMAGAVTMMERCRLKLAQASIVADNGETFGISGSFGLACNQELPDFTADMLIKTADTALYRAKETGRNRVESVLLSRAMQESPDPA